MEISEDQEGYISLKGAPPTTYRRRCSRSATDIKPRIRLKRCRSIELENESPSGQFFEDERVGEGEKTYNPWALKCHRDNLKKMGINLVQSIQSSQTTDPTLQEFILLENLTYKYKYPCVLDLKVGTRQYGDGASLAKKLSKNAKVAGTTSGSMGLRLGGMQVYQATLGRFLCRTKNYGRSLSVDGLKMTLRQFFCNGLVIRMDVIQTLIRKLTELKEVLERLDSYRFYTSSILVTYDGTINQNGSHIRCCRTVETKTRNSLSTGSLLQLSGRCTAGMSRCTGSQSHSFDDLSFCFHVKQPGMVEGMSSRKKSVSFDNVCSLSSSPELQSFSIAPTTTQRSPLVDVKIIDFAHSTHRGLRDSTIHEVKTIVNRLNTKNY